MDVAYRVTLRRPGGEPTAARLRLLADGARLEPLDGGAPHELRFEEIAGVDLDPSGETASGLTIVLAGGDEIELASNVRQWILSDLLGGLFAHRLARGHHGRVLVRVRLRPGSAGEARRLLQGGPPFDPSDTALVLHEVFVVGDEALFLFETNGEEALLSLARPDFWQAAGAWSALIGGTVRLVEPVYSWEREGRGLLADAHPGLGL
jgi:hypothetical protein